MTYRHHSPMQTIVWFACMLCMLIWAPRTWAQNSNPCSAPTMSLSIPSPVTVSSTVQQGPIGTPGQATITFTCPSGAFYTPPGGGTKSTTLQTNISGANSVSNNQTYFSSGINGISVVLTAPSTTSTGAAVPPPAPIGNGNAGGNGRNALATITNSGNSTVTVSVTFTAQLYVTGTVTAGGTTTLGSLISSFQNYTYGTTNSNTTPYGGLSVNAVTVNVSACKANSPTVVLPTVSKAALSAAGATTGITPFPLSITGCPTGTQLAISFSGTRSGSSTTVLQSTGSATNVGVQMLSSAMSPVDMTGTQTTNLGTVSSSGSMTVPYYAQYYATGQAGAGSVAATATFTLSYP